MKTTNKIIGGILFLAIIGFTMAACGKSGGGGDGGSGKIPDGTYVGEAMGQPISYTFSGKTMKSEMFGAVGEYTFETRSESREINGKKYTFWFLVATDEYGNKTEETYSVEGKTLTLGNYELTRK
jgi:hypothetical protein